MLKANKLRFYMESILIVLLLLFFSISIIKGLIDKNRSIDAFKEDFLKITQNLSISKYEYIEVCYSVNDSSEMRAYLDQLNINHKKYNEELSRLGGIAYNLTESHKSSQVSSLNMKIYEAYHGLITIADMNDKYSVNSEYESLDDDIKKLKSALSDIEELLDEFKKDEN